MTRLRRIAVFVEEVGAGNFHWVLHEQGADASEWIELSASPMAYDLWLDAFEDGCAELVRMCPTNAPARAAAARTRARRLSAPSMTRPEESAVGSATVPRTVTAPVPTSTPQRAI
ncbi:hypothetical protein [Variovorax sp.]|uniref:hypothetical protein n=1 Tax=Variovorax sp. TaxID=1871043 RepID=UPI003BAA0A6F